MKATFWINLFLQKKNKKLVDVIIFVALQKKGRFELSVINYKNQVGAYSREDSRKESRRNREVLDNETWRRICKQKRRAEEMQFVVGGRVG